MNINQGYKSSVANAFDGEYKARSVVPADREAKILSPTGDYSTSATIEGMIKDINQLHESMGRIGVENGFQAAVYKITDRLRLTSPQTRLNKMCNILMTESSRLDRVIAAHWDELESIGENMKETAALKRDAKSIMYKYMAMEQRLAAEENKLLDERCKIKDEIMAIKDANDPKMYNLQEMQDSYSDELDKIKTDARAIRTKVDRASGAVIKFNDRLTYFEHQRQVRECVLSSLEKAKTNLDLKINELKLIAANNGKSLINTFGVLRDAQMAYEGITRQIGNLPDEINRALTGLASDVNFQGNDTGRIEERTKELKRVQDRNASEVQKRAEEIIRKDAAA
ncbi:MAG: hypothetical protein QXM31_03315 [Candidatus Woesearchaeota archaeon]